jgi:hypothetical protein
MALPLCGGCQMSGTRSLKVTLMRFMRYGDAAKPPTTSMAAQPPSTETSCSSMTIHAQ